MRKKDIKNILFTSGSGVYGDNKDIVYDENHGPLVPISTYGASKIASEALISSYCKMYKLKSIILRFANVVGSRQTHGVGFDFVKKLKENPKKLDVLGDGSQCKSYIHISDIIKAISLVTTAHTYKDFEIFNVATNDYITVKFIAEQAVCLLGSDETQILFSGGDRGWNGDVPIIKFDSSKIRKMYNFKNKYTSHQAIIKSLKELI